MIDYGDRRIVWSYLMMYCIYDIWSYKLGNTQRSTKFDDYTWYSTMNFCYCNCGYDRIYCMDEDCVKTSDVFVWSLDRFKKWNMPYSLCVIYFLLFFKIFCLCLLVCQTFFIGSNKRRVSKDWNWKIENILLIVCFFIVL